MVEAEVALLRAHGHSVTEYRRDNHELEGIGRLSAAMGTVWSTRTTRELADIFEQDKLDILHAHNTFPLISPSMYWAAEKAGVPVVQTLHNFRLLCPQAMLLRDGKACEQCVNRLPLPGIWHACYRDSRAQTGAVAAMLMAHRALGTWSHKVARYIALNEFCRGKFIEGGLPASKIVVKPNFVDLGEPAVADRSGFLFVGRLAPEKGIGVLARSLSLVPNGALLVAGAGAEADRLKDLPGVRMLGVLSDADVQARMCGALALVLPSIWYENFPRTLVEAFACGLPVIASRLGALADLVQDGVNGLLFEAGNPEDLAAKMRWAQLNASTMHQMGRNARANYEENYTAASNYSKTMSIYESVLRE